MKTRLIAALAALVLVAAAPQDKKKQILFFTKSAGFEHSVIKKKGDEPSQYRFDHVGPPTNRLPARLAQSAAL